MPYPPRDGGAQLMHYTTKGLLENNVNVKTLAINPSRIFVDPETLPGEYKTKTRFESVRVDTTLKPFHMLSNIFRSESYFTERFASEAFDAKLRSILQAEEFDLIQIEHLYLCRYIKTMRQCSAAKIILRPLNVEYVIWERYLENLRNPLKRGFLHLATERLKKYEENVSNDLDGIRALTNEDADLFRTFSCNIPVRVVPMGYDYENLVNYNFEKQFSGAPVVYHLGAMDWLPNVEAVEWFLTNVIPILEKQNFSAKIVIAGRKMPSRFFRYGSKSVEILDAVDSPLEFQEDKPIMIVPLLSGSGIRAKIIEGLALGKTIISTSVGIQGINYENGENIILADTPSEFAGQIIKCVNSGEFCRKISKNARNLSMQQYHYRETAKQMLAFYEQLPGINRSSSS